MGDSFAGQKFRVAALSAQAEQAVDVERACRSRLGMRTRNTVTRGKVIVLASVAGLVVTAVLRRRRKRAGDADEDREPEDAAEQRGILAKAGMAVLIAQRLYSLAGPFMRGMQWAAQRDERTSERSAEAAYTSE